MNTDENFCETFFNEWKKTEGLIRPSDAAKLIGVTRQSVNDMIDDGRLKSHKVKDVTFLSIKDISLFIHKRNGKTRKTGLSVEISAIQEKNT